MQQELIARNWRELIRPRRLELDEAESSEHYGRFWCEPLERGFGLTLGNALRRVLLSVAPGRGDHQREDQRRAPRVLHRPGCLEDVSDIVLNLKEVRLRLHAEGPKTIRASTRRARAGSRRATSSPRTSPSRCSTRTTRSPPCRPRRTSRWSARSGTGKGYVLAERNKTEEMPIGTVPIDSIFSPIRRVNYTVTPARVGRETDFDR